MRYAQLSSMKKLTAKLLSLTKSTSLPVLQRQIDALELLWKAYVRIEESIPRAVRIVDQLDLAQYERLLKDPETCRHTLDFDQIAFAVILREISRPAEDARIFAGPYAYSLFAAYRASLLIAGWTIAQREPSVHPWYASAGVLSLLRAVLSSEEFRIFSGVKSGHLGWLHETIARKLIAEAERLVGDANRDGARSPSRVRRLHAQAGEIEQAILGVSAKADLPPDLFRAFCHDSAGGLFSTAKTSGRRRSARTLRLVKRPARRPAAENDAVETSSEAIGLTRETLLLSHVPWDNPRRTVKGGSHNRLTAAQKHLIAVIAGLSFLFLFSWLVAE